MYVNTGHRIVNISNFISFRLTFVKTCSGEKVCQLIGIDRNGVERAYTVLGIETKEELVYAYNEVLLDALENGLPLASINLDKSDK